MYHVLLGHHERYNVDQRHAHVRVHGKLATSIEVHDVYHKAMGWHGPIARPTLLSREVIMSKANLSVLWYFLTQCMPLIDLCGAWTPVDQERPRYTPFLLRQGDQDTGLCLPIYGCWAIAFPRKQRISLICLKRSTPTSSVH